MAIRYHYWLLSYSEDDQMTPSLRRWTQVLSWLSFDKSSVNKCVIGQLRIMCFYYWAAYSILKAKRCVFCATTGLH